MPFLPISDGEGGLLPGAGLAVFATMLYPTNDELSSAFQASWRLGASIASGKDAQLSLEEIKALDVGPGRKWFEQDIGIRQWRADVAAAILQFLIHHAERDPQKASLRKAVNVIHQQLKGARMEDGSQPRAQGVTSIFEWWAEFRPAVHLWAASSLLREGSRSTAPELLTAFFSESKALLRLLALGEDFRRKGQEFLAETWLPDRRSALAGEYWASPGDLRLPHLRVQSPRKMTDWASERVDKYRAK